MPDYQNNRSNGGARGNFSRGGFKAGFTPRGRRDFGDKQMFDAECNSCHKTCQVPFRPNGMKPVYCSDCFKRDDDRSERPRFDKRDARSTRPAFTAAPREDGRIADIQRELTSINAKLERLTALIESGKRSTELTEVLKPHATPASKPVAAPKKPAKKAPKKKA